MNSEDRVIVVEKGSLKYIQFKNFKKYEYMMTHAFTTRHGGISSGECSSLNLGFNRNDTKENVLENYRRIGNALNIQVENMVLSKQVHESRIREVGEADRGNGITKENNLIGYDGLMTDVRNIALVTFYADCVPVLFFDPGKKVIAASHSGWRGTVKEIAGKTISEMSERYGSVAGDIEVAVGPSIGSCCFEVGDEVYREFVEKLPWSEKYCIKKPEDKYHINLQGIVKKSLLSAGVKEENIDISGICTKCNKDMFFSHRGDLGKTGSMAAIMQLI